MLALKAIDLLLVYLQQSNKTDVRNNVERRVVSFRYCRRSAVCHGLEGNNEVHWEQSESFSLT